MPKKNKLKIVQFPADRMPLVKTVVAWSRRNKKRLEGSVIGMSSLQWCAYKLSLEGGKTQLFVRGTPVVKTDEEYA